MHGSLWYSTIRIKASMRLVHLADYEVDFSLDEDLCLSPEILLGLGLAYYKPLSIYARGGQSISLCCNLSHDLHGSPVAFSASDEAKSILRKYFSLFRVTYFFGHMFC